MSKGMPLASIREAREKLAASELLSEQSARRFDEVSRRFESFCLKGFGVDQLSDVTLAHVEAFVRAKADGKDPAAATMHMRRTALRLLFRIARAEFGFDGDPTLDLVLPPKSGLATRPLTDDEISLGRSYSLHNIGATRGPAAWALGEATAITSELPCITTSDLDLDNRRVWLHGSNKRVERWATLTDWGVTQLERRARALQNTTHLIYQGTGSEESGLASCCTALKDTLVRAGLDGEADVRPNSVAAWATKAMHEQTGRIEDAARAAGIRSLDATATFIGFDWHQ
jgi:hypothetical protein